MAKPNNKPRFPSPKDATLSVVIPAYNAEAWIKPTLEYLGTALEKSRWGKIEIIVIDDGSKDQTAKVASTAKIGIPIKVIKQANMGRLTTRKNGLGAASGDYVFLLDSRVFTHENAFAYLSKYMEGDREAVVWNGHIEVERVRNPYARFWYAITFIAWRRYMARPRLMHYGTKDFDYYPKGAGCFFAPRELFLKAYEKFQTGYKEDRFANDDTALIRLIAGESDIYLSPQFAFTYNSRSTLKAFLKHTLHRGIVLIDGYLHSGTRYFWPIIAYLLLLPIGLVLTIIKPMLLLLLPIGMLLAFIVTKLLRLGTSDALALIFIGPIFALYYSVGLYEGVFMRLKDRKTN